MRILQESEKIYAGIDLNSDVFNKDKKDMSNHYKMKNKKGIVIPSIFLSIILFIILGIALMFFKLILGIIFLSIGIVGGIVFFFVYRKYSDKQKIEFIKYYSSAIEQNAKINNDGAKVISEIFPIYFDCDNTLKAIKLIRIKKTIMFCEYDDILNYRLLFDEKEIEITKMIEFDHSSNYTIEITFNNKKKSRISFDNRISKLKINNSYNDLEKINEKSIAIIIKVLDDIIMKNIVD